MINAKRPVGLPVPSPPPPLAPQAEAPFGFPILRRLREAGDASFRAVATLCWRALAASLPPPPPSPPLEVSFKQNWPPKPGWPEPEQTGPMLKQILSISGRLAHCFLWACLRLRLDCNRRVPFCPKQTSPQEAKAQVGPHATKVWPGARLEAARYCSWPLGLLAKANKGLNE